MHAKANIKSLQLFHVNKAVRFVLGILCSNTETDSRELKAAITSVMGLYLRVVSAWLTHGFPWGAEEERLSKPSWRREEMTAYHNDVWGSAGWLGDQDQEIILERAVS